MELLWRNKKSEKSKQGYSKALLLHGGVLYLVFKDSLQPCSVGVLWELPTATTHKEHHWRDAQSQSACAFKWQALPSERGQLNPQWERCMLGEVLYGMLQGSWCMDCSAEHRVEDEAGDDCLSWFAWMRPGAGGSEWKPGEQNESLISPQVLQPPRHHCQLVSTVKMPCQKQWINIAV